MRLSVYLISLLVMLLVVVTFTLQNTEIISVRFIQWQFESSVAMLLFLSFSLGILFSVLLLTPMLISKERNIGRLKSEIEKLNKEPVH